MENIIENQRDTKNPVLVELHNAVAKDQLEQVTSLIKDLPDLNSPDEAGALPLHRAVSPEIVSLLVEYGADVNHQNRKGETPLYAMVCQGGRLAAIRRLLELNANPLIATADGSTPLGIAHWQGDADKIVLLARGVFRTLISGKRVDWFAEEDARDALHRCLVCGLWHEEMPWGATGSTPTFEICSCCGVEFGYEDSRFEGIQAYRDAWLTRGAPWEHKADKPTSWDLGEQLANLPLKALAKLS